MADKVQAVEAERWEVLELLATDDGWRVAAECFAVSKNQTDFTKCAKSRDELDGITVKSLRVIYKELKLAGGQPFPTCYTDGPTLGNDCDDCEFSYRCSKVNDYELPPNGTKFEVLSPLGGVIHAVDFRSMLPVLAKKMLLLSTRFPTLHPSVCYLADPDVGDLVPMTIAVPGIC